MDYEAADGTVPRGWRTYLSAAPRKAQADAMIDAVTIDSKYPYMGNTTALDRDELVPQFKEFADRVKEAGSTLVPQIIHQVRNPYAATGISLAWTFCQHQCKTAT